MPGICVKDKSQPLAGTLSMHGGGSSLVTQHKLIKLLVVMSLVHLPLRKCDSDAGEVPEDVWQDHAYKVRQFYDGTPLSAKCNICTTGHVLNNLTSLVEQSIKVGRRGKKIAALTLVLSFATPDYPC